MDNARRLKLNQKKEEELQFRAVEIRNFLTFPYRDVSEYACGHADDTP